MRGMLQAPSGEGDPYPRPLKEGAHASLALWLVLLEVFVVGEVRRKAEGAVLYFFDYGGSHPSRMFEVCGSGAKIKRRRDLFPIPGETNLYAVASRSNTSCRCFAAHWL